MNGKKARKLREQARAATIGQHAVAYIREAWEERRQLIMGKCTRKYYKDLKRGKNADVR